MGENNTTPKVRHKDEHPSSDKEKAFMERKGEKEKRLFGGFGAIRSAGILPEFDDRMGRRFWICLFPCC